MSSPEYWTERYHVVDDHRHGAMLCADGPECFLERCEDPACERPHGEKVHLTQAFIDRLRR